MIYVGEQIELKATFSEEPTTPVKISLKDSGGVQVNAVNMTAESATVYTYQYTVLNSGDNTWSAISADNAIEEKSFSAAERRST